MPGWKTSIAHCKSISDLPPNAKAYAEKIWELSGIPGETMYSLLLKHEQVHIALLCTSLTHER